MSKQNGGNLPLTFNNNREENLKNYRIYGTASGAGVETENLADFIAPLYTYDDFYQVTTLEQAQRKPNCILLNAGDYTIYANLTSDIWNIKAFTETGEVISDNRFSGESLISHPSSQYWYDLTWKTPGNYWYFVARIDLSIGVVIHLQQPTWILICSNTSQATQFSITPGSTAPSSYIPHGYKLPIIVTSNGTTTDYPVYIGDSKLGEEEYVDYESGKVHKRTGNDFPFAEKGTFAFGDDGNIISDGEGKLVVSMPSEIPSGTNSAIIPLNRPYTIPKSVGTGGEFFFYLGNNVKAYSLALFFYDGDGAQIDSWRCSIPWRINSTYYQMAEKTIACIGVSVMDRSVSGNIELTPMFSKNANLTSYIPYLQPTDPPVPLPSITAYKGENTLSSSETMGNVIINYGNNNISIINVGNISYDIIDESFYSIVADDYDSQQSYSIGDYCIYDYQLYKCNANTSGDWDSNKWILTNLTEWLRGD